MNAVAVTMHCERQAPGQTRDALDQRWPSFLSQAGLIPIPVPNHTGAVHRILDTTELRGVLFTGGDDLARYGGHFPQRDAVESKLLAAALDRKLPILGVGRGMQVIQNHFGVPLKRVQGHAHAWGTTQTVPLLTVWSQAEDGVVKAVRHTHLPIVGIMWHPEFSNPFQPEDLALFGEFYNSVSA